MAEHVDYYGFLAECLSRDSETAADVLAEQIESPRWDWQALIRVAAGEKILPAVPGRLSALGLDSKLPGEIADFLAGLAELSLDRNRDILSETANVAAILNTVGIEPVLLKGGAYLVDRVYPDFAARYLADIDLLVGAADLPRAVAALRTAGYEGEKPSPLNRAMHHYPTLRRSGGTGIELHHRLGLGPCASILSTDEVAGASRRFELHGARLRLPCPEHLAAHHIMHSQVHHEYPERIWPSLRAMYDLVLIERRFRPQIDWRTIEARFKRARQHGALLLHLKLMSNVLGFCTPLERPMNVQMRLRWRRRQILRKNPALRKVDLIYLTRSTLLWRTRLLREVAKHPGGWNYLLRTAFRSTFYRHLQQEIAMLPQEYIAGK